LRSQYIYIYIYSAPTACSYDFLVDRLLESILENVRRGDGAGERRTEIERMGNKLLPASGDNWKSYHTCHWMPRTYGMPYFPKFSPVCPAGIARRVRSLLEQDKSAFVLKFRRLFPFFFFFFLFRTTQTWYDLKACLHFFIHFANFFYYLSGAKKKM